MALHPGLSEDRAVLATSHTEHPVSHIPLRAEWGEAPFCQIQQGCWGARK